jgi:hypothetical protein
MADTEKAPKPPLCFVIGPIGKDGSTERKHADLLLHAVIKHALKAEGYTVKRADEDADPGMIGDRVISDIIHAELVVADLTDLNPNAFYELGIRHSTEKPTIHVAKAGTVLPFDTVAHRTVFVDLTDWRSTEAGRAQLAASARAIKGSNYRVSNPITQANASFQMRGSADPLDRVIADLQQRLGSLEIRSQDLRPARVRDFQQRYRDFWAAYEVVKPVVETCIRNNMSESQISSAVREHLDIKSDVIVRDNGDKLSVEIEGVNYHFDKNIAETQ